MKQQLGPTTSRAPSRNKLVAGLRQYTPATMDGAAAYNGRKDQNGVNAVESVSYVSNGARRQLDAIANALEAKASWPMDLAGSLSYLMLAGRLSYFWHTQFRVEFPNSAQPLRSMNWEVMTNCMAFAFMLGWNELATYQGHLAHAALNRKFQLVLSYEQEHRRAHAFMLRLFASWRNDGTGHAFPAWAHTVPVYEEILQRWRSASADELAPLLEHACDQHLAQAKLDTAKESFDFGDDRIARVPLEILMLMRLREAEKLTNPRLSHPLMEAPFDALPIAVAVPEPDEYMRGTLARARVDWPNFDAVLAAEAVRAAARMT